MRTLALCALAVAASLGLWVVCAEAESRFYPFVGVLARQEARVLDRPNLLLAGQLGTAYSLGPVALQLRGVLGPSKGRAFGRFEVEFGARVKL